MATNFLYATGTNGFIVTPFNIVNGTDLQSLANGANVSSSGSVLTQTDFGHAIWCEIEFQAAGAFTPTAGGYLAGWFPFTENASNFEKVVAATDMPRPPDFTIPLFASAYASGDRSKASGLVRCPAYSTKAYIGNRSGVTLSANSHIIYACPIAVQY